MTSIRAGIEPVVAGEGCELVDVCFAGDARARILRLYVDRPEGVTLADCERISRAVGDVLDVNDWVQGRYHLEVSSPGLDRPLRTPAHFERFTGQMASVTLVEPQEGRRNFKGELRGWKTPGLSPEQLELMVRVDEQNLVLPFLKIERAQLVPQFAQEGQHPRGKPGRGKR